MIYVFQWNFSFRNNVNVECPTCHAPLLGTLGLRNHIRKKADCLWKKLSSPKEIEKEILAEVRRQRKRTLYHLKHQRKETGRKRVRYEASKETQDPADDTFAKKDVI